jgi:hypothetical protein
LSAQKDGSDEMTSAAATDTTKAESSTSFGTAQADRCRPAERRLCRSRPSRRPCRDSPARLALRHPQLRRRGAVPRGAGYRLVVPYLRGYGTTRFLSDETFRNGQQAALALDVIALLDALELDAAILAGFDWGTRTADIVAALWPERCKALVSVSGSSAARPRSTTRTTSRS